MIVYLGDRGEGRVGIACEILILQRIHNPIFRRMNVGEDFRVLLLQLHILIHHLAFQPFLWYFVPPGRS